MKLLKLYSNTMYNKISVWRRNLIIQDKQRHIFCATVIHVLQCIQLLPTLVINHTMFEREKWFPSQSYWSPLAVTIFYFIDA